MNQPKFAVNLLNCKPIWFPDTHQLFVKAKNKSVINSIWLGVVWNILAIPERIVKEILWPLFNFHIKHALFCMVMIVPTVVLLLVAGLRGKLQAVPITKDQYQSFMIMAPEQQFHAKLLGFDEPVTDVLAVIKKHNLSND